MGQNINSPAYKPQKKEPRVTQMTLPTDSTTRKDYPMSEGLLAYFPAALGAVAKVSKAANAKHNPGEPMHHARAKSGDHSDCIIRHLVDVNDLRARISRTAELRVEPDPDMAAAVLLEVSQLAWRALALSQELHETYGNAPLAPGAK